MAAEPKAFNADEVAGPLPYPTAAAAAEDAAQPVASGSAPSTRHKLSDQQLGDARNIGAGLAEAMMGNDYHPVVLFGTSGSGKTSLLLSLFSTLIAEPRFGVGLSLCTPLLGSGSAIGKEIHAEAMHTFDVKTQMFLMRKKILKTTNAMPFFIPVKLTPFAEDKAPVHLAFMESAGEDYRPDMDSLDPAKGSGDLYRTLNESIDELLIRYERPITFIYLAPYTQSEVYAGADHTQSAKLREASLAIKGAMQSYWRTRTTARCEDYHLLLVTKWDAHRLTINDAAAGVGEDREALDHFVQQHYAQAVGELQGITSDHSKRGLNAYCAGEIDENGLRARSTDQAKVDELQGYPIRLWKRLYTNALAPGGPLLSPFVEPQPKPALLRALHRVLDFVSGHRS